jgi:TonB family protein
MLSKWTLRTIVVGLVLFFSQAASSQTARKGEGQGPDRNQRFEQMVKEVSFIFLNDENVGDQMDVARKLSSALKKEVSGDNEFERRRDEQRADRLYKETLTKTFLYRNPFEMPEYDFNRKAYDLSALEFKLPKYIGGQIECTPNTKISFGDLAVPAAKAEEIRQKSRDVGLTLEILFKPTGYHRATQEDFDQQINKARAEYGDQGAIAASNSLPADVCHCEVMGARITIPGYGVLWPRNKYTKRGQVDGPAAAPTSAASPAPAASNTVDVPSAGGMPLLALPKLLNRDEVLANLRRLYPEKERVAGREADVSVVIHIGVDGIVTDVDIKHSSAPEFDEAAQKVGRLMRFSAAIGLNGQPVPVLLPQPIQFRVDSPAATPAREPAERPDVGNIES